MLKKLATSVIAYTIDNNKNLNDVQKNIFKQTVNIIDKSNQKKK